MRLLAAGSGCLALQACGAAPRPPRRGLLQVNLAGYENTGPIYGTNYILPSERTLRYFKGRGVDTFRLTMFWQRLQPLAGGPFSSPHADELGRFFELAAATGVRIIADLHASGGRDGAQLGSPQLPTSALASFWGQFAERFAGACHGYDLMNEPHDMPDPQAWPRAAQETVDAVRKVDRTTYCYVEGDDWSNAGRWEKNNPELAIHDPVGRLIYSAHLYFDADTSGQYRLGYDADGADPAIGPARLAPFVDWLRARGFKGHIGEFGAPYKDPRWIRVLDAFMAAVYDARDVLTGAAYWAAGEWMDFYDLSLQPTVRDGRLVDQPQLGVLLNP